MTVQPLLTLRDLARELGLPESTVRYYRDAFAAYLPAVGQGRRRRYPPETLGLLRFIADAFAQNRRREDVQAVLAEMTGLAPDVAAPASEAAPSAAVLPPMMRRNLPPTNDELLATILDGERDRREVMWQMAREIVRLGEAIERQHMFLEGIARRLDNGHMLPAAPVDGIETADVITEPAERPADPEPTLSGELDRLRQELQRERELVDRLRKAKLDIERRAAEAEQMAGSNPGAPRGRSVFGRLLNRDDEPGGAGPNG